MSNSSKVVSKLVIEAYKDEKYTSLLTKFNASINPESLRLQSNIQYNAQHIGTSNLLQYGKASPRTLSFRLLFDQTGIIPASSSVAVSKQLHALEDLFYDRKTKVPNYIRVIWGEIDFKGRLQSLEKDYTLMQVDGTLARVEVALRFIEETFSLQKGSSEAGKEPERAQIGAVSHVKGAQTSPSGTLPNDPDKENQHDAFPLSQSRRDSWLRAL